MSALSSPRISPAVSLIVALIAGASVVVAFSPFNFYPMALLAFALLWALWRKATPAQAAKTGYSFGVGQFGAGVYWVYNSVHEFGQAPAVFAIGLTLFFVLFLSLYPALVGWLQAKFRAGRHRVTAILLVPALWVLIEWIRGWFLTGFPWLQFGYSQTDSALGAWAPVFGVLGVTWIVVLLAVALVELILASGRARRLPLSVLASVLIMSLVLPFIHWSAPEGKPIQVSMVQGNIPQEFKWEEDWLLPTMQRYRDMTEAHWDSDLIIWPEAALPGIYQDFDEPFLQPLTAAARENKTDVILGTLYQEGDKYYNSVIALGSEFGLYHKRHLVPFGEYIPLRNWISWLDDMVVLPSDDISRATDAHLLHAAGVKVAASVCYEDAYGDEMSEMLPEANLLVNVSNDAWFGRSLAPHQHLQIARMRAMEFSRPMLRTTNTGVSAVIGYRGEIEQKLPQFETAVMTAIVQPRSGATPYVLWGNHMIVALMLLSLGAGYMVRR